ncbi:hypothetical protein D3C77_461090 [compost metagenome]
MHFHRIGAIEIYYVGRNPLPEVSLKAVYAHIQQCLQLILIPTHGCRVRKINQPHTALPPVPLPYIAVLRFHEIAVGFAFVKQVRLLGNVGINPYTNIQAFAFESLQHALRIGEYILIPFKVAPMELLHPEAIEMKHMKRDVTLAHAIDKAGNRIFVIARCKRSRQPQAIGPGRRQCRFSRQLRVVIQYFF